MTKSKVSVFGSFAKKIFFITALIVSGFYFGGDFVEAQELHQDIQGQWRAKVIQVVSEEERIIPGIGLEATYQTLWVEILEGEKKGELVLVESDFLKLKEGDKFFLNYLITIDGDEIYSVREPDRRGAVWFFVALFALTILAFGRMQGVRSLISLAASFLIIIYLLLPALLSGAPPVLTSTFFAALILLVAIYFTHGVNRESHSAFAGTVIAVIFTGLLAYFAVEFAQLTGFASDEAVYLNLGTEGRLDFRGLLLGAIIIGILGVLDDIAISQAHTVKEIHRAAPALSRKEVYSRALSVGREHVGALVNTLALAYAGAALPLLLFFSISDSPASLIVNREIFSTEIIRTLVGSIGLIFTVPVTTWLSAWMIIPKKEVERSIEEKK